MDVRLRVLLFELIHLEAMAWLRGRAEVIVAHGLREDTLMPVVGEVQGIVIRATGSITERVAR